MRSIVGVSNWKIYAGYELFLNYLQSIRVNGRKIIFWLLFQQCAHLHAAGRWGFPHVLQYEDSPLYCGMSYSPTRCRRARIPLCTAVLLTYTLPDGEDSPMYCGTRIPLYTAVWGFPYTLQYELLTYTLPEGEDSPMYCSIRIPCTLRYYSPTRCQTARIPPIHCGMRIPLYLAVLLTYTLPDSKDLTIYCSISHLHTAGQRGFPYVLRYEDSPVHCGISHLHAAGRWWFPYTLRYYSPTSCWTVMISLYTAVFLTYTLPDSDDSPIHCGITHLHAAGRWWFPYTLRYYSPTRCRTVMIPLYTAVLLTYTLLDGDDSPIHCGMLIPLYTAVLLTYTLPDGEDSPMYCGMRIPLYTAVFLTYMLLDGDDSPIHCGITHLHAAG